VQHPNEWDKISIGHNGIKEKCSKKNQGKEAWLNRKVN
jgi:hypothetical protein